MLIVDNVQYTLYSTSNEDELETFVEKQAERIFGQDSLYFSVKTKLKSLGGVGSIPDAYAITLTKPQNWFLVEIELSSHSLFNHIVPQLNKFVQGLNDPNSRRNIVEALYNEIKNDPVLEAIVKEKIGSGEIFRFLSSTIDKPPILIVIIDEKTRELEEACSSIPISDKRVVEFKIYKRNDAGIKNAFIFDSIIRKKSVTPVLSTKSPIGSITPQPEYAKPILEALVELGGGGKVKEVLEIVHDKMKNRLTKADLETVPSGGEKRWSNHVKWERFALKSDGYLKSESPRGVWEISEKGRKFLKEINP